MRGSTLLPLLCRLPQRLRQGEQRREGCSPGGVLPSTRLCSSQAGPFTVPKTACHAGPVPASPPSPSAPAVLPPGSPPDQTSVGSLTPHHCGPVGTSRADGWTTSSLGPFGLCCAQSRPSALQSVVSPALPRAPGPGAEHGDRFPGGSSRRQCRHVSAGDAVGMRGLSQGNPGPHPPLRNVLKPGPRLGRLWAGCLCRVLVPL